jgi:hypothetical protein
VAGVSLPRHAWKAIPRKCREYVTDPTVTASERARRARSVADLVRLKGTDPDGIRCVSLQTAP